METLMMNLMGIYLNLDVFYGFIIFIFYLLCLFISFKQEIKKIRKSEFTTELWYQETKSDIFEELWHLKLKHMIIYRDNESSVY